MTFQRAFIERDDFDGTAEAVELPVRERRQPILLPAEYVPCIDDFLTLRIMADQVEEAGNTWLARLLRWTANEWEWRRGLQRAECQAGLQVWARYGSAGWSPAFIEAVGPIHVRVRIVTGSRRHGQRAWWDLVPMYCSAGDRRKKPKPRKGYGCQVNAELAGALAGRGPPAGSG